VRHHRRATGGGDIADLVVEAVIAQRRAVNRRELRDAVDIALADRGEFRIDGGAVGGSTRGFRPYPSDRLLCHTLTHSISRGKEVEPVKKPAVLQTPICATGPICVAASCLLLYRRSRSGLPPHGIFSMLDLSRMQMV
jgi:hypothetical protein